MSKIEVDAIDKQSGSTLTLGGSGTAVTLASGATQSGFGRTGTVNWVTTKKTTGFTAVSGEGYFCDTAASGAFTLTLPASPSAGDIVGLKDYNGNFATANLTIGRNSQPINGGNAADVVINTAGASIFLVYVDATQGWVATQDDESVFTGVSFICASVSGSGNTLVTAPDCANAKIATFTGPGNFTVNSVANCAANNLVSYLVVAGGGGAGGDLAGGAGAGGFRETKSPVTPYTASPLDGYSTPGNRITVTAQAYGITVGGGGAAGAGPTITEGCRGSNSTFSTITSTGGGAGMVRTAQQSGPPAPAKSPGGSGGGGSYNNSAAGTGNTPPVTPPQGNNGGATPGGTDAGGGGGGGATAAGGAGAGPSSAQGPGGAGATTNINSSPTTFAGGGGGGGWSAPSAGGSGGAGGGGAGGDPGSGPGPESGTAGTANTGGGGGGAHASASAVGGAGGSGIVIIRYKFQ
ncbi:putative structural protein [phage 023Pt_psg01]|jgi:hypothetical protein|nr:putative structural protein [phage 023Pt_psg01]